MHTDTHNHTHTHLPGIHAVILLEVGSSKKTRNGICTCNVLGDINYIPYCVFSIARPKFC
jgi:hypothetical protein